MLGTRLRVVSPCPCEPAAHTQLLRIGVIAGTMAVAEM
jgi:hypothetical protein